MRKLTRMLFVMLFAVCILALSAYASDVVMTVNGTEYTSQSIGWVEAVKLAKSGTETTVKLFADWIAESTDFVAKDAEGIEYGTRNGSIYIDTNGLTLDLNGYTVDRNIMSTYGQGRVMLIENATFTIDDTSAEKTGKITGGRFVGFGYGAGIYVDNGNLTLNGGSICGNYSAHAAGVYINNGTFTMNGGSITENISTGTAGGVYIEGKGTEFIMNGGEISYNLVADDTQSSTPTMSIQRKGGGVYADSETIVTMNGGSINHNITNYGAGVFLAEKATMNLIDGSIENNTSASTYSGFDGFCGGGIHVSGGTLNMLGGTVNGNEARYGGGIYAADNSSSKVIITGGKITGNIGQQQAGGIYHGATEKLIITDCEITDNKSLNAVGGGLYVAGGADVYLGGTIKITNNKGYYTNPAFTTSNVFLSNAETKFYNALGQAENIPNKPLEAGAAIGVELADSYFNADKYFIIENSGFTRANTKLFTADYVGKKLHIDEKTIAGEKQYFLRLEEIVVDTETYKVAKLTINDNTYVYSDFNKAWEDAIEKSTKSPVTFTLLEDWVCGYDGNFADYSSDAYTHGALYLHDSNIDLTVDLNGHKLDRNRYSAADSGQVFVVNGGTLRIKDSVGGGKITGAKDCDNSNYNTPGGAIYVYDGNLYIESGEISGNTSDYRGGGIYWDSNGILCITGGKIVNNTVTSGPQAESGLGGGVYVSDYGDVYIGGDAVIDDNHQAYGKETNVYLQDKDAIIKHAVGQKEGVPNSPLKEGAYIGVYAAEKNEMITGDGSCFNANNYRYFHSDDENYLIRSVYDAKSSTNAHQMYVNDVDHPDARNPYIKSAKVKDSNLLVDSVIVESNAKQTIFLTAHNTRRNFFETIALSDLIECTYDSDTTRIVEMHDALDLREGREYKLISDNGTYVTFDVVVHPYGGNWATEQESVDNPFRMIVTVHKYFNMGFTDFDEGWAFALNRNDPVTVTLFRDWIAPYGSFDYSMGTENGYFLLNEERMDITIDLNGNTINRDLKSAVSDGYLFRLEGGAKLRITDNSATGGGKITGGYNDGDGGAFYVNHGELYINGGEISGNKATNGGAIYGAKHDETFIYINGGKICKNEATDEGGAIFMYNGSLYVDGGEISGNKAINGGGIYWESRDILCLTGGVIKENRADEGAGVYATDWGDMYIGGTIIIIDNYKSATQKSNFYISDTDAYLNNAAGQPEVPDKPLTTGASVYISAESENFCFSDSNSRFTANSVNYLHPDSTPYRIRSVYNANGGDHTYKLYYDNYINSGKTLPAVDSIEIVSSYIDSVTFNNNNRYATLFIDIEHRDDGSLTDIALSELVSVTFKHGGTQIVGFDEKRDFTQNQEYVLLGSDGTYVIFTIYVEWECTHPTDEDGNGVCDVCGNYILTAFAINRYEKDMFAAVVYIPEAGTYTVVFVDYEDGKLKNIDIVEEKLNAGFNAVYQDIRGFKLNKDDKIMLMSGFKPLCKEHVVK